MVRLVFQLGNEVLWEHPAELPQEFLPLEVLLLADFVHVIWPIELVLQHSTAF